ncbi:MAG: hypothetical protein U5J98_06045 [Halobacteriales archaeon]|nr:hypothetical protein [Halobacteriales archaeon]
MTTDDLSGGPLDIATLEVMGRRATSHPLVVRWRFRPDGISPRVLEVELDASQYPNEVTEARVDVRWFEGGAYTVHYLEIRDDAVWQCRWDRHPKPEAPMAHFHPPPNAGDDIEPSMVEVSHPFDVLFAVLAWIEERVQGLFEE